MSRNTLNIKHSGINAKHTGHLYLIEGEVPYLEAWEWQRCLVLDYKRANQEKTATSDTSSMWLGNDVIPSRDALLLLQHKPVYTLGHGADTQFLRFDPQVEQVELHRIERGGEVTYHCPGQLVGYPILDLHHYQLDLHWYLRALEEVLIRTLAHYGLTGERIEGLTGVWIQGYKVAAIGIKVSRWITMHGFALNVCPDLTGFEKIVPCGIEGKPVGSMAQFVSEISVEAVQHVVIEQFEAVFGLVLEPSPLSDLKTEC
ncbi:MAG: lipoyl(octanoyl) transferase LipB [Cyanobacteria bacterium P01_F01_bin.86]